jgi:glucose-1-phosphate thymidylyltransferase
VISVILAAGYATRMYPLTLNTPKPLLPVGGEPILTRMFRDIDENCPVRAHVLVSNHKFFGAFAAWRDATASAHPVRLIDDGSTDNENRLGAVRDLLLAVEALDEADDLLVCAADNLLDFSLARLTDFFGARRKSAILCYREADENRRRRAGVISRAADGRVTGFEEKPAQPKGEYVAPPFYALTKEDVLRIRGAIEGGINPDAPGSLIEYLHRESEVYSLIMPGKRYDVGDLETYRRLFDAPPADLARRN